MSRRRADFKIYDFVVRGALDPRPLVRADPAFHPRDGAKDVEPETIDGGPAKAVVSGPPAPGRATCWWSSRGPLYHHFFCHNLRDTDLLLADHIIGSLKEEKVLK
ncbi:MAG: hypothetical protein ACM3O6_01045 [Acidobacteriota bacterium]